MSHYCKTVNDIKDLGYKIKVFHSRIKDKHGIYAHKGGSTEVHITDTFGNTRIGIARCNTQDSFVRRVGVAIAIGRALKNL
jgi:hypothetical protein